MHDLATFRSQFDRIAERLATRAGVPNLDQFRDLDKKRRAAISETEDLKAQRNRESAGIAEDRKKSIDTTERQKAMRAIGDRISQLDEQAKASDDELQSLLKTIPNLPHESVPVGKD